MCVSLLLDVPHGGVAAVVAGRLLPPGQLPADRGVVVHSIPVRLGIRLGDRVVARQWLVDRLNGMAVPPSLAELHRMRAAVDTVEVPVTR